MSDRSATSIRIGGTIRRADLDQLAEAIAQEHAGADWDAGFSDTDQVIAYIEASAAEGEPLVLFDSQAPGGQFPAIEKACHTLGLAYVRADDGHYTWSPTVVLWQPGMTGTREWTGMVDQVTPHLDTSEIRRLRSLDLLDNEMTLMDQATGFCTAITITE